MKKQNDGGAAFPLNHSTGDVLIYGLTKRDYFAAAAMEGLIASGKTLEPHAEGADTSCPSVASRAIEYADALIKELGA